MKERSQFLTNLDCLSIALCALYSTYSNRVIIYKGLFELNSLYLRRALFNEYYQDTDLGCILVIQFLINIVCERKLQVICLVLLLESAKSYSTYNNYLRRYRILFRKYFTSSVIKNCHYKNDNYIDVIALINLRVILLCSGKNGIYFLWLYLVYYRFNSVIG